MALVFEQRTIYGSASKSAILAIQLFRSVATVLSVFAITGSAIAADPASVSGSSPSSPSPNASSGLSTPPQHNRLEELFIWKTSEDLKLPPNDELKFTEIIHQINLQRHAANQRLEEALKNLANVKTKPEIQKALIQYRVLVKDLQNIQVAELDRLEKLLGPERMSRYLVLKNETTEKLKNMLSSSSSAPVVNIDPKAASAAESK